MTLLTVRQCFLMTCLDVFDTKPCPPAAWCVGCWTRAWGKASRHLLPNTRLGDVGP